MITLRPSLTADQIAMGFDSSTDIFKHKDLAERLTSLFASLKSGSVCLLDGRWGTGKSTFVRQWRAELNKSGVSSVYFDAFASDYVDTPFTALAGIFVRAAHDARKSDDPSVAKFLDKAAKIGRALAATTAKVGIKAATLGAMDGAEIEGLSSAIADGLGDITESSVRKLLEEHSERESQFAAMRSALVDLTNVIKGDFGQGEGSPIIIFIDELDRCRPDFSLGILEILKHFFSIDGLHFVLVSSKSYLELAVDGRYGAGVSGSEYLEKFYDFIVVFEKNYEKHVDGNIVPFISLIFDKFISVESNESSDLKRAIKELCIAYRLTLRQIENLCINACLAYLSVEKISIYKPGVLVAFAALVKAVDLEMYRKMRSGNLSWDEAERFINSGTWSDSYGERLSRIIQWHLDDNINERSDEWAGYSGNLWNYNLDRLSTLKYICNSVIDRFSGPSQVEG